MLGTRRFLLQVTPRGPGHVSANAGGATDNPFVLKCNTRCRVQPLHFGLNGRQPPRGSTVHLTVSVTRETRLPAAVKEPDAAAGGDRPRRVHGAEMQSCRVPHGGAHVQGCYCGLSRGVRRGREPASGGLGPPAPRAALTLLLGTNAHPSGERGVAESGARWVRCAECGRRGARG